MRGAAMSLTAAASGLVVFLLSVSVVQGQDDWGGNYTSTEVYAVKGSTVEINCTYKYPSTIKGSQNKVNKTFWFIENSDGNPVDVTTVSEYAGCVEYRCENNICTLRIKNLTESDSAEYKFRIKTNLAQYAAAPGVTLFVCLSVTGLTVQFEPTHANRAELKCQSSCLVPSGHYVWYENGEKSTTSIYSTHLFTLGSTDRYSCALKGHEDFPSPAVYAPRLPSVSVSAEIKEGSSVTLTCSSDANPAANYTWYKVNGNQRLPPLTTEPQLVLSSIQVSDSGQYLCTAENTLGKTSEVIPIDVKYPPKLPSVSVSPSEIEEGSSVTLTCSSDANPAANYTWYKRNQTLPLGVKGSYNFTSIRSEDRGNYYCKSENQYGEVNSSSKYINVQYAPKPPSVSVSPSAEIEEGSSVTLTCSSDANPAANYTWYKKDEDSPKASGQIFTITDFSAEHSGSYSCGAQNKLGRRNSTLTLIVVAGSWKLPAAVTIPVVLLAVISLSVFLWIRRKRASRDSSEPEERADIREECVPDQPEQQEDLQYASVHFNNNRADPLDSNMRAARPLRHTEQQEVSEYAAVKFSSAAPRTRGQDSEEDPAALYSTVNKSR
ncbi:B-cell receptor CD22-like isoform X2 [Trematomus bernacchii]|uniref:B-cell receptor CD22-like isoform X2 n=1 Tax=Trematomus bernacchii TaxID=40690 RepID=UPI00146C6753|nr:B-cell receptor CD22-like isoform X2 [Trematomus bernacchii]